MDDIELKPCPHCGGCVELDPMMGFTPIGGNGVFHQVAVYCVECPAHMSFCHDDWSGTVDDLVDQIAENWNSRVPAAI